MKKRKNERKRTFQTLALISQLGLMMIVSIGVMSAFGIWLDRRLGTSFITVIMFVLGCIAGGQSAYRMIKQIFDEEDSKDDTISKK